MFAVIAEKSFTIKRSTGDVNFENCDAKEINVTVDTGDVVSSLLSEKAFITDTGTGKVNVPHSTSGGKCKVTTSTMDIKIHYSEKQFLWRADLAHLF